MAIDTFDRDNLIAGDTKKITPINATMLDGEAAAIRGALLGKVTASGKFRLSKTANGDGSEVPSAVLADDVDASGGDEPASIYLTGEFNENVMVFGTGHTADNTRDALHEKSIFLKKPLKL